MARRSEDEGATSGATGERADIAIVGMAGRFPGAGDVDAFWANIVAGKECFTTFTDDDLRAAGVSESVFTDPNYVRSRPVLDEVKNFDAGLFGLSPREATFTDPQQRLFTECAWSALEMAGYGTSEHRPEVGVFAGTNLSTYLFSRPRAMRLDGGDTDGLMAGNDKDALATSVAYRLDLRGPSVAVQSFCSTSLVAVHLAAGSLRAGECDLAIAGGVSVRLPDRVGYTYQEGNQASPDGHVRTFDAQARGSIFGDGVAVVVLKRLDRALADRDHVLAVIRGSAVNNDGAMKFSYQAPSIEGQRRCVTAALADAGVDSADVSYVEAHGTATEVGDPMEVAALTAAFRQQQRRTDREPCLLGSVKPNVGHLDRASGVTGLIKVVQSLRHETIPGTRNFVSPNPEIDFDRSPFRVTAQATSWPREAGRTRIAGISSLGMGGTNVHAVVTEAPPPVPRGPRRRRWQVLPVSARYEAGADAACENLAAHLQGDTLTPDADLGDVAHTLQVGRARFHHRRVVVADSAACAVDGLTSPIGRFARTEATVGRKVAFLFAGVGEQYAGMLGDLYAGDPEFRADVDECVALLGLAGVDELSDVFTGRPAPAGNDLAALLGRGSEPAAEPGPLDHLAQPAVFVAEHALARHLERLGVSPDVMVGYSVGEYVAACRAGVLSLPDALRLVSKRAELIAALPRGSMLAVAADEARLTEILGETASLDVAVRTGSQLVLAGPDDAVSAAAGTLQMAGVGCRILSTTHAFHSHMLRPAAAELTAWVRDNITAVAPTLPYYSNVTGELVDAELVTDPGYWARHMCETVDFDTALGRLLAGDHAIVEIGPGQSLGALVRAHASCDRDRWPLVVPTVPGAHLPDDVDRALTETVARLWLVGVDVDWRRFHEGWQPGRVPLPGYPFEHREYWLEADLLTAEEPAELDPQDPTGIFTSLPRLDSDQWINCPVWSQTTALPSASAGHLLIFARPGEHDDVVAALRAGLDEGARAVVVHPGDLPLTAAQVDASTDVQPEVLSVRPGVVDDLTVLLRQLESTGNTPTRVVHLWGLGTAAAGSATGSTTGPQDRLETGLNHLVAFARASGELGAAQWRLDIVTSGTQRVLASDHIDPEAATLLGPARLIPVEYPGTRTRLIDVDEIDSPGGLRLLCAEISADPADQVVALREGRRWVPSYQVLPPGGDPPPVARFRTGGTYLITGGLGGIGLAMAERIASDHAAQVVLLGRTAAPPRAAWTAILDDPATTDEVRRRVEGLRRIDALGHGLVTIAGDVSSTDDVRAALDAATARFGRVDGVLHCAGVPAVGLMQFKSDADMAQVLAPKMGGARAIAEATAGRDLDFVVLFSSTTSATGGGAGQVDYCAANTVLDAYAVSDRLGATHVVSIGWGEWTWNGWTAGLERYDEGSRTYLERYRATFGIDFDEGWQVLQRVLATGERHVVVSTQDFPTLVAMSRESSVASHQEMVRKVRGQLGRHPRPDLATAFVAPESDAERAVAEVWADALGLEQVGAYDNFFDLGGNSLVGMEIIAAVRAALDLAYLPPHLLYQAPTVAELARAALTGPADAAANRDTVPDPGFAVSTPGPDGGAVEGAVEPPIAAPLAHQSRVEMRRSSLRARRTA
ncbi:type I polyketide synthase [Nocardioides sp. GXZ039]|uniref:type I polyketide synthase n=1 Tax=Nocardioides sp. GXZ039 TaxID=3136018 RepID=UPI0030F399B6